MSEIKVAVVTGATSGIGKAAALALAGTGWTVVLAGRRADKLQQAVEECQRAKAAAIHGASTPGTSTPGTSMTGASTAGAAPDAARPAALGVQTDVTDPASVRNLFARAAEVYGRVDLLFNNAGISAPAVPVDELPFETWKSVVDTNLTGMFLCLQAAVRQMKNQAPRGGRIINNGSIAAYTPRPNSIAYTATKHAVTGLTKATSLDGRAFDIACGQIDIGNARTELATKMPASGPNVEPLFDVQLVGRAVVQMAELPLEANVQFMTIMATKMPYIGRG